MRRQSLAPSSQNLSSNLWPITLSRLDHRHDPRVVSSEFIEGGMSGFIESKNRRQRLLCRTAWMILSFGKPGACRGDSRQSALNDRHLGSRKVQKLTRKRAPNMRGSLSALDPMPVETRNPELEV
jgi:hypothetical protein